MKENMNYRGCDEHIHLVYVYLINEFKTCYVGRTKELHKRDLSHRRGRHHSDGSITYDGLYTFCSEKNIPIPEPTIKDENLTGFESLIREDYWVNYYRENGWTLLNKAKTGAKSGSLGHTLIWTYEACREECKKYKTRAELRKYSCGCYEVCLKEGWLSELILVEGKHPNGYWHNKDNVIQEAKKYNQISDFIINAIGAYKSAKKNGWLDELPFKKEERVLDVKEIWEDYQRTGDIKKTIKNFNTSYNVVARLFKENGYQMGNHNRKDPLPEEMPIIEELLKNGVSQKEIERRFNISRKRLKKIFCL